MSFNINPQLFNVLQEGEGLGAYGEWVPVDKTTEKAAVTTKTQTNVLSATPSSSSSSSGETAAVSQEVIEQPAFVTNSDKVFPDPQLQVRNEILHLHNRRKHLSPF